MGGINKERLRAADASYKRSKQSIYGRLISGKHYAAVTDNVEQIAFCQRREIPFISFSDSGQPALIESSVPPALLVFETDKQEESDKQDLLCKKLFPESERITLPPEFFAEDDTAESLDSHFNQVICRLASPYHLSGILTRYGIRHIPVKLRAKKAPDLQEGEIEQFRAANADGVLRPTEEDRKKFFQENELGVGILLGSYSQDEHGAALLVFDFEIESIFKAWYKKLSKKVKELLKECPVVRTPGKYPGKCGFHVYVRLKEDIRKIELAHWLDETGKKRVLLEVLSTGQYVVCPGSPAAVHEKNEQYQLINGHFGKIPTVELLDFAEMVTAGLQLSEVKESFSFENQGDGKEASDYDGPSHKHDVPRALMEHISADCIYDDWVGYGMILKAAGFPKQVWIDWSKTSKNQYCLATVDAHWKSFAGSFRPGDKTLGTLFKAAFDSKTGFMFSKPHPVLHNDAFIGIAGDFVKAATDDSEADPAAILVTFLTRFGAHVGNESYVNIADAYHPPRVFSLIVGRSAKSRKGTSMKPVNRVFKCVGELAEDPIRCSPGPCSSGEGLVECVRDASEKLDKDGVPVDLGVADKRVFIGDGEMGAAIKCAGRDGSILSAVQRALWDDGNYEPLTANNKRKCTDAHFCIVGHITETELMTVLSKSDTFNGWMNRYLIVLAKRSKIVSRPKGLPKHVLEVFAQRIANVLKAIQTGEIDFDKDAGELWDNIHYTELTKDKPGTYGAVTDRAEAQVIRLSIIYALLDGAKAISVNHLRAALAVWDYCDQSAKILFAQHKKEEPPKEEKKVLTELALGPKSRTHMNNLFGCNLSTQQLDAIINPLIEAGKVVEFKSGKTRMYKLS